MYVHAALEGRVALPCSRQLESSRLSLLVEGFGTDMPPAHVACAGIGQRINPSFQPFHHPTIISSLQPLRYRQKFQPLRRGHIRRPGDLPYRTVLVIRNYTRKLAPGSEEYTTHLI